MDGSVDRATDRVLIPATPARGRVGRDKNGESFQLDSEEAEQPDPEANSDPENEVLPVGEATYDEVGKRLDVTA